MRKQVMTNVKTKYICMHMYIYIALDQIKISHRDMGRDFITEGFKSQIPFNHTKLLINILKN